MSMIPKNLIPTVQRDELIFCIINSRLVLILLDKYQDRTPFKRPMIIEKSTRKMCRSGSVFLALILVLVVSNRLDATELTIEQKTAVLAVTIVDFLNKRVQPNGVCLYSEPDFKGERVCFSESQPTLDVGWDNQASSVGLTIAYYVLAYSGPNYTGTATLLNDEMGNLGSIDNTISSIEIGLADDDGDGVHALDDSCANTPSGESVDAYGCSATQIDTDEDGVMDAYDMCAATVVGASVDIFGCTETQDGDGDGIANQNDSYPYQSVSQCTP